MSHVPSHFYLTIDMFSAFALPCMYQNLYAQLKLCSVFLNLCYSKIQSKISCLFHIHVTCWPIFSCSCTFQSCWLTELFCFENWLDLLCNLYRDFLSDTICSVQIATGTFTTPTTRVDSIGWPQIRCDGLVSGRHATLMSVVETWGKYV